MGFPILGALSAVGGLASNLFNIKSQKDTNAQTIALNRENNSFNAAEAEKNRQFQQKMANTEISRRVADLRASGMNPAFSDINASSIPSGSSASAGSAPSLGSPHLDPLTISQIRLNESQADKNEADAQNTNKATDWMDALNQSTISINESNISVNASNISLNDKQKEMLNETIKKAQAETSNINEQTEKLKAEIGYIDIDTLNKGIELYYKSDLFEAQIEKLRADAGLSYSQARDLEMTRCARIRNLVAQSRNYDASSTNLEAATTKIELESGILSVDYEKGKIDLEIKDANKDFDKFMYKVNGTIDAVGNTVDIVQSAVSIKNLIKGSVRDREESRHNHEMEKETKRHNEAKEQNSAMHEANSMAHNSIEESFHRNRDKREQEKHESYKNGYWYDSDGYNKGNSMTKRFR